jgi:hypothetical protein
MPNAKASEQLESYLDRVRHSLRGLAPAEVSEILQELRSHVMDFVAGDMSDARVKHALERLGDPQEIARMNMSMRVAARSLDRRSPVSVLQATIRLARLSLRGAFTLFVSLIGYAFAASWLITALAKPFSPQRVGLWALPGKAGDLSLSLGSHGGSVAGHDLLGWWIMPVGLLVGIATAYLTYRFDLSAIRRMARLRPGREALTQ